MRPYPLVFNALLKHRVWGGRRLARWRHAGAISGPIGESWEVADLPDRIEDGRSVIANGALAGRTLGDAIEAHRNVIMGDAPGTPSGGFPLLVKYLDARENLSVQVHPPASYVADHPGTDVKNEAWVVLEADPGAVIYRGVREGVSPGAFAEHIRDGSVVEDLIPIPARAGECHYLPSGTCHALGAGVFVAEVQTPSDTTFRVFDWGRTGRTLHVEQALQCIEFSAGSTEAAPPPRPMLSGGFRTTPLVTTPFFELERIDVREPAELPVVTNGSPVLWMIIAGAGTLTGGGSEIVLGPGTTVLHPAEMEHAIGRFRPGCSLLRVALPSPTRGILA